MSSAFEFKEVFSGGSFAADGEDLGPDPEVGVAGEDLEDFACEGVVKWFRSDKGYGFVALSDRTEDAFLHLKALRAFGRESATPGAKIKVVVEQGARGVQVTRVLAIEEVPQFSFPSRGRREVRDVSSAVDLTGRVKWFDDVRGFGFVASDDYGRDVFVHCTVLGAAGVGRLDQGQTVSMRVIETPKGREAIQVSL